MLRKNLVLSAFVLSVVGASALGVNYVSAQTTDNSETTLVQKIADKFSVKKEDVQAVFDEHRSEQKAQMDARFAEKLDQLVKDGKLTETQKQALSAKMKELQTKKMDTFAKMKDMTPEERKQAMQSEKDSLDTWAKDQGIDLKTIFGGMGKGFRMRGGMHMHGDMTPKPTVQ